MSWAAFMWRLMGSTVGGKYFCLLPELSLSRPYSRVSHAENSPRERPFRGAL